MQIDLKGMNILPAIMMFLFSTHISITFNVAGETQMASYLSLALVLLSFVFACILIIREKTISQFTLLVLTLMLPIEIISLYTNVAWKDWLYYTADVMLMMLLFQYYKDNLRPIIIGAAFGFSIAVYLQLHQCITHPEMWMIITEKTNVGYLLGGNYNSIGCRLLCAIVTNILALRISRWWWLNFIGIIIASLAIEGMVQSMTSLTSILLIVVLSLIPMFRLQRIAPTLSITGAILFEFFVCFQGKGFENNDLARWILVDVLGKDMTFTGRTSLWDSALRCIYESPIFGYGNVNEKWFFSEMSSQAIGPHNFILGLLLNGGIFALVLYVWICAKAFGRLLMCHDRYANGILIVTSALFLMMLMEYYPIQFSLYLFTLAFYYIDFKNTTGKEQLVQQ